MTARPAQCAGRAACGVEDEGEVAKGRGFCHVGRQRAWRVLPMPPTLPMPPAPPHAIHAAWLVRNVRERGMSILSAAPSPFGLRPKGEPPVVRTVAGWGQGWVPRSVLGPPPTADRPKRRSFDRISARIATTGDQGMHRVLEAKASVKKWKIYPRILPYLLASGSKRGEMLLENPLSVQYGQKFAQFLPTWLSRRRQNEVTVIYAGKIPKSLPRRRAMR